MNSFTATTVRILAIAVALPSLGADVPSTRTTITRGVSHLNVALRDELIERGKNDQKYRAALQERLVKSPTSAPAETLDLIKKQAELDRQNIDRIGEIVRQFGWPGRSLVGEDASTAAFMIVQHAELKDQQKYLPLLEEAAKRGEAKPADVAMLEDRVLTREGKKQRYGTQLHSGPDTGGKLVLYPIDDEEHVDERRAAVGLPPLAEYLKLFNLAYQAPAKK